MSPEKTRIGWIGTGVMGRSMCGHILDAGYAVTVFNRTKSNAEPLLERGATWADTPRDVAAASNIVFSIVGYPDDVCEVLTGDDGALGGAKPGTALIDMTTSRPRLAIEIAAAAEKCGVVSIDAPVSGGDVGAKNGTLSIMIGGDAETVAALEPLWKLMGSKWIHQGGPGAGQHTKMVNQVLIATNMIGVCEALLYGYKAGLDLNRVLESVASGAAGSWSLSNLGPRIIAGNFDPGFFVEHFLKDMAIALEESRRMGLKLHGVELAEELYREVAAQGMERQGTHALMLALAKMAGVDWTNRGV
ncbi:MAG: NAD(P)-dependent oxidoreductase [Pirellulales bacterium]